METIFKLHIILMIWGVCEGQSFRSYRSNSRGGAMTYPDDLDVRKPFPQHHHHSMHFNGNRDADYYHGGNRRGDIDPKSNEIPVDYVQNLMRFNVSDLLLNFVDGLDEDDERHYIQNRFGDADGHERNAATMPKEAACIPEVQTIKIAQSDDPTVLYIPQCTRIERCGGCCSHSLLACQPTQTETVFYKVIKTQYTGGRKLKFVGKEVIPVEKHTKCKCDCRVHAKDCNKFQIYNNSECRCICKNSDEEQKCHRNSAIKLWNPEICACQCREVFQCSTGSFFDHNDCKCVPSPTPLRKRPGASLTSPPEINDYEYNHDWH